MHLIRLTLAFICASWMIMAHASEEEDLQVLFGDEEFVSIATGNRQPITKAPAVASVITYEEMKSMGATDLDDVLETVPGLHVSLSPLWFSPIYSIRGIYTDINPQVLVLINGIPITQIFAGDRGARFTLPIESISRVEVIRGPGSAIYGADAFAGVINVITRGADTIKGTEFGARIGSFDTQESWVSHGENWGDIDVAFSLEWKQTNGDDDRIIDADRIGASGPADTEIKRLDARLDLSLANWQLRLWNWRQNDMGTGPGIALALDPKGQGETSNYLADLTYHNPSISGDIEFTAQATFMEINTDTYEALFPPGTTLPIGSDGNINSSSPAGLITFTDGLIGTPSPQERHARLDLSSFYTGFDSHRVRIASGINWAGLEAEESKNFGPGIIDGTEGVVDGTLTNVTDTPFIFVKEKDRTVYYVSLQDEWSFAPDWDLTAGIRYDHYSDFGDTINPRAALVWQTRFDLTTKLLYGRAFRAPSFAELYSINNPIRLGNSDLDPETIDTLEIAFNYLPTFDIRTSFNLFHYWIDDLILLTPSQGGTSFEHDNAGKQKGYGLEWEIEWEANNEFKLLGNYAFQDSENLNTNADAGNAPHHQVYLRADWHFLPDWSLVPQINWVFDRERVAGDSRSNIDNYALVNLTLRRKNIGNHWEFAFLIHNLFDKKAREPSPNSQPAPAIPNDFPLPSRSIYGEIRYKL